MTPALCRAVSSALVSAGLWQTNATLLAGVSGGADSVALLHTLCALQPEAGYTLYACHIQHGLRGESSLEDERFVRRLCDGLHVPLSVLDAGLAGSMADAGMETRARERRRALFAQEMARLHADALLLAHHRDDQAETVLLHLLRGAGGAGLSGMRTLSPFAQGLAVRPFLKLPKSALLQALQSENLPHREDGSNGEPCTPRNTLRLTLLPEMERLFPGVAIRLAQTADALAVDEDFLAGQADTLYAQVLCANPPVFALEKAPLAAAHEALRRRALRRWYVDGVARAGLSPDERALSHADTLALSALCFAPPGDQLNLPHGLAALVGVRHLHLLHQGGEPLCAPPARAPIPLSAGRKEYELFGLRLSLAPCSPDAPPPDSARSVRLTKTLLAQAPVLRAATNDDRMRPFGAKGAKPLRRILTDRKVDAPFRMALPVLAVGSRVLWIPGLLSAEELRAPAVYSPAYSLCLQGLAPYTPYQQKE